MTNDGAGFLTVATIAFVAIAIFLFVTVMRTPGPILPPLVATNKCLAQNNKSRDH